MTRHRTQVEANGVERLAADVMESIRRLRRRTRRLTRQVAVPCTPAQIEVLQVVADSPGIGVTDTADALGLATNTVSTLVKELVGLQLLDKAQAPADRRAHQLSLTPQAQETMAAARNLSRDAVAAGLGELAPADCQAIRAAVEPLQRLADLIETP